MEEDGTAHEANTIRELEKGDVAIKRLRHEWSAYRQLEILCRCRRKRREPSQARG